MKVWIKIHEKFMKNLGKTYERLGSKRKIEQCDW